MRRPGSARAAIEGSQATRRLRGRVRWVRGGRDVLPCAQCPEPARGVAGECRGRVLRIGQADFGGEARSAGTRKAASNLSVRGDRAPSNAAASVTAVLASQGFPPVSRRSRSRNATERNEASHAFDASRSEAEVEWRRGHCGSLAPWGAEQGWRVFRCRQAQFSGRRQSDRRAKAATLAGRGRVITHTLRAVEGGPQRSATKWRSAGGVMAQQAQTGIVAGGAALVLESSQAPCGRAVLAGGVRAAPAK